MKKEFIGYLAVILSGMLLSLELYGLKFLITISIVILGFILIIQSKKGN